MNDIEYIFHNEVREKKRIGSNIHKRTGTRGYVGAVRFTYDLLRGKEKREYKKNGKVVKYNMNDVLPYDIFQTFDVERQKQCLSNWRENFNNDEIISKMGISKSQFYDLINHYGLKKKIGPYKDGYQPKKRFEDKEIEFWKENLVDYNTFKLMFRDQQHELFSVYEQQFSTKELAELWNVKVSTVYGIRSNIKKWLESKDKQDNVIPISKASKENKKTNETEESKKETLSLNINGKASEEIQNSVAEIALEYNSESQIKDNEDSEKVTNENTHPKKIEEETITSQLEFGDLEEDKEEEIIERQEENSNNNLMTLQINDELFADDLYNKLEKVLNMIKGESSVYKVKIELIEVQKLPTIELPINQDNKVEVKNKEQQHPTSDLLNLIKIIANSLPS